MIYKSEDSERRAAFATADKMAAAAKTAPKGSGKDKVISLILDGNDKTVLSAHMRDIAEETGAAFFERDAGNVDASQCVVLIGVRSEPFGMDHCGMCGFKNCGEMAKAGAKGYYNEMLDVIGTMMSQALKDNTALKFSVFTGCLRISKESIFTGTNNFVADTIADERFSSFFGFTDEEVRKLLENTGNLEYFDWIKKWYDGYCFGKTEIYCPWDVLCYLNKLAFESESEPENFWENTKHNDIIRTFLSCEGMDVTDSFEKLLADETIEVNITENLTYEKLTDLEENLWSVLYLTGYLTKDIKNPVSGKTKAFLKIPNAEIMDIFRKSVVRWFDERIAVRDRSELFKALWNEDAGRLSDLILELLFETISYHDYAESFYHAF